MPKHWTIEEKKSYFKRLSHLYIKENKTIGEISKLLGIAEPTVYQRLKRLGIKTNPEFKKTYLIKKRTDINIPRTYTPELAEFFGIMLGDGKLSKYQVVVNLGSKEMEYAKQVVDLIKTVFGAIPKIAIRKTGYKDVYLGSVDLTAWLRKEGLVYNKVLAQVDVPKWIFRKPEFMKGFIRGFFDTDGSIYKLRWGTQISFTNKSLPLLKSIHNMLIYLKYTPSKVSGYKVYITKKVEVQRFFDELRPRNIKHQNRFREFSKWADTEVVKRDWL